MKHLAIRPEQTAQKRPTRKDPAVEGLAKARPTMADFWIKQGWYEKLQGGKILFLKADWQKCKGKRQDAVRFLVEKVLKKDPKDMTAKDFLSNGLGGLLINIYHGSPYAALTDAGYAFHPWEMIQTPHKFYKSKANRIKAVNWLVRKLGKEPRDVTSRDYHSNRLGGLLNNQFSGSPYATLKEASLVTSADKAYFRRHGRD